MTIPSAATPTIRWAHERDRPAALVCYERNGYSGGIRAGDRVLVAERDGRIVGVVRLVDEEGHRVLRGMYLDEVERGRGLGRSMLLEVTQRIGPRTCWLVCSRHLAPFYGEVGFQPALESEAPPHLRLRAIGYGSEHGPQVVLRRQPSG